ncbi:hypothetical protein HSE3_gp043 [Bacillus phage vB_BceM-HSE3]|nr:hypothetical protein HSE3_gp043 [Bacillus phage vB_BceM-HSE3]
MKCIMTIGKVGTDVTWEEELTSMVVTEDSPHYKTHETGMHDLPKKLSKEELTHYAHNLIDWFNRTRRSEHEKAREIKSLKFV